MMASRDKFQGRVEDGINRPCDWPGCESAGAFRAPLPHDLTGGKGGMADDDALRRMLEGGLDDRVDDSAWFCLQHVRDYNAEWDFFDGMNEDEINDFRDEDASWHRPTWPVSEPGTGAGIGAGMGAAQSAGGELWLLDVGTGAAKRLAQQVDLAGAPVWSPESDAVFVRRSGANGVELVRVELSGAATVLAAATNSLATSANGLYVIDVSPDGEWLYYAVLSAGGTDVARASVHSGKQEPVAHLSDGFSRDWKLSPNGDRLSYLAQANSGSSVTFVAQVLDISTGLTETPLAGTPVAQFNPVWERGGGLTIGQISDGSAASAGDAPLRLNAAGAATAIALPEPASGFDVPLSWSPDGARLAVRSFEGRSAADPGPSRVVVVRTDGARFELSRQSDVAVAGWLTSGS